VIFDLEQKAGKHILASYDEIDQKVTIECLV
jgi:hypothetical protein